MAAMRELARLVAPSVAEDLLRSRARGLLELFRRKGLLPRTIGFLAALDDIDGATGRVELVAEPG